MAVCHLSSRFLLAYQLIVSFISPGVRSYVNDELFGHIFTGYNTAIRPRCNDTNVTRVGVDMALRQIIELDEPHQYLDTLIWLRLTWTDCRLRWNSSQYGDIKDIIVPQNKVWVPDLTLYDNSARFTLEGMKDFNLLIKSNGDIRYNFPTVVRSLCGVNVKHFPFDYQSCKLTFGSWAYSGTAMDMTNVSTMADLTSYVRNNEWHLIGVPVIRLETMYGVGAFPTVTFLIQLKRLPLFYALNLIFPCLLITSIAILGFLLPPASGEKVNLEITVLLSLAVFQLIVLELMPPTGDTIPFMGLYFVISLVLVGLSCFMTVLVLKIHFEGDHNGNLPGFLKTCMFIPLARIFCVKIRRHENYRPSRRHWKSRFSSAGYDVTEDDGYKSPRVLSISHDLDMEMNGNVLYDHDEDRDVGDTSSGQSGPLLQKSLNRMLEILGRIEKEISERFQTAELSTEWQTFALLLDRFFLSIYILSVTAITIVMVVSYIVDVPPPDLWFDP